MTLIPVKHQYHQIVKLVIQLNGITFLTIIKCNKLCLNV